MDNRIIDTLEEISNIVSSSNIFIPIYRDSYPHSKDKSVVAIYITDLNLSNHYIVPINHSESILKWNLQSFVDIWKNSSIFVYDKKTFIYHVNNSSNIFDLQLAFYYNSLKLNEMYHSPIFFNNFKSDNYLIPIAKLFDHIYDWVTTNQNFKYLNLISTLPSNDFYLNYENTVADFKQIENNGIRHSQTGIMHGHFNLFTATGRPSNSFNGINYAALSKQDDTRKFYIPKFKNGLFYNFDYQAFHPTILANFLKLDRPKDKSIHQWLGEFYFSKENLTEDEYNESKTKTFYFLYGNINSAPPIPFFNEIHELCKKFEGITELVTPIFKRKIYVKGLSTQVIFNYFVQALETEINFIKIRQLNKYLSTKFSTLVLYTYDSFLIDFHPKDSKEVITKVKEILEWGDFKVTTSVGKNYKEMTYI